MTKKKISATLLSALTMLTFFTPVAEAGEGYRGGRVNGCQGYISGRQAWTNCIGATATGSVATKVWCTAEPTHVSSWVHITRGSTAYNIAKTTCSFNVHTAQAVWQ